jgi:hypothetical protein
VLAVSVSEHVRAKGARLLHAGRVREVTAVGSLVVKGGTGRHLVTLTPDSWTCECRAFVRHCWHFDAVRLMIAAEAPEPAPAPPPHPATEGRGLYTGSWRHVIAYERAGLMPVRISLGAPRWIPGSADRWPAVRELMPVGSLFAIEDAADFELAYRAHLDRVGVPAIDRRFRGLSAHHQGRPLVLLCFEVDPANCHRSTFAHWWLERTGQPIREA